MVHSLTHSRAYTVCLYYVLTHSRTCFPRLILDEADRLLDMGFEQTIVEALGIIRGCALPGYDHSKGDGNKQSKITLHQKYSQQLASMAKTCTELGNLVHIMASATLTNSVKSLAMPMMGK